MKQTQGFLLGGDIGGFFIIVFKNVTDEQFTFPNRKPFGPYRMVHWVRSPAVTNGVCFAHFLL